jgi:Ca2+-binding EF-hand superfamily protein
MVSKLCSIVGVAILVGAADLAAAQSAKDTRIEQAVRQIFHSLDGDADGKLTNAEFMQVRERDFAALDANRDSVVTKEEFLDPKLHGIGQLNSTELVEAKQIWSRQFAGLDTDKNGKLTMAEDASFERRSFEKLDGNKDGDITLTEMMTAIVSQK